MGQHEKALQVHLTCLNFVEKRAKSNPRYLAVCLGRVGTTYLDRDEYDQAMNYCMKSNKVIGTCYPSDHVECGKNFANIGTVHYMRGDIDRALLRTSIEYSRKMPCTRSYADRCVVE
ncbi:unnamed protein product [Didymodactylos carnosus]|uniref:Uncharacterized protein n=1 Tax=Didymodactylos carnosus TaxID=1234261 RepID=A0A815MYR8_9BILA|nr:unnamed protein product [Didymodactylos carnosus]CAF1424758.1 unnamed protein product [Didymodactylos carnosus]CAF3940976.1 unnamed protein product [Didymodactylos carnosus]CAF4305983.1 unnamed protein product [Didymodactylos carnosus]